jgi:membrane protein DedA with SNARE-associated domain
VKLGHLLAHYGYPAILVGAFLEGESIVLLAGFFAKRGHFALWAVSLLAFAGSFAGDQLAYFAGRYYGEPFLRRFPKWRPGVARVHDIFERRGTALLVGFRFLYGLRNLVPFTVGLSGVAPRRFLPWNALGAAIWAPAIASAGYFFGKAFEAVLDRARSYEIVIFGVAGMAALVFFLARKRRAEKPVKPT